MTIGFDLDGPEIAPTDAATVILVRDGSSGPEVFFVRRRADARFMGGAYVFPGGKLDADDGSDEWPCDIGVDEAAARLGEVEARKARALHIAAMRECFEESGVLLCTTEVADDECQALRARVGDDAAALRGELRSRGWTLAASRLAPLSRWVTPRGETRRFDARFFIASVSDAAHAAHDAAETVASLWLRPVEALERAHSGHIVLVPPTYRTVELLSRCANVAEMRALSESPLARFEPVVRPGDDGAMWIVLPGDPLHPDAEQRAAPAGHPAGEKPGLATRFSYRDGGWTVARRTG